METAEEAAFISENGDKSFLVLDGVKSLFGGYQKPKLTLPIAFII